MTVVIAMVKFLLGMALGFILYKLHILDKHANSALSGLILYGTCPCMIFAAILSIDEGKGRDLIILLISGVVLYMVMLVIVLLSVKLLRPGKDLEGVYVAMLLFGNTGFLGFPVAEAFFGAEGLSYMAILNAHQTFFVLSIGVFFLTKDNAGEYKFSFKKLMNPGIIAAIVALLLYFIKVPIPTVILEPIRFIGSVTSPMAMIVIGSTIATYKFANLFNNWRYYICAFLKLLLYPAITFVLAKLVLGQCMMTNILALHMAMPTAAIVSMLAITYKSNYEVTSSETGLLNVLSIGTMPLVYLMITTFS